MGAALTMAIVVAERIIPLICILKIFVLLQELRRYCKGEGADEA